MPSIAELSLVGNPQTLEPHSLGLTPNSDTIAVGSWANHFACLKLRVLICKMEIIVCMFWILIGLNKNICKKKKIYILLDTKTQLSQKATGPTKDAHVLSRRACDCVTSHDAGELR